MNRRRYLQMLAGTGALAGLAGCNSSEDETPSPSATRTETPKETPAPTPEPTPTASGQAPSLVTATTTPQDAGQALQYQIVATDDQGLEYVAVVYGDRKQEWDGEGLGKRVGKSGEFTDLGQPPEDGQVVFGARDSTGKETQEERYPDEQAPRLSTVQLQPTANAGEIHAKLQGEDNVGLEELQLLLDGQPAHQENVSGQSETSLNTTVDVSDLATVGEENSLSALLEDWNGNSTRKDSDTYVRKFDKMEDTRLRFGAVYETYNNNFGNLLIDSDERIPIVGQFSDPIPKEVFERHLDQMQGHGINRITLSYPGHENTTEDLERFLETELVNELEVEPFYNFSQWLWGRGKQQSADNYREELVKPHMNWIRENIFSRENIATYDDRPIVQSWNPGMLAHADIRDKVLKEYGSYEAIIEDMRDRMRTEGGMSLSGLVAQIGEVRQDTGNGQKNYSANLMV